eukprot:1139810-Pelagomonas_calceolata.AAC.3
MDLRSVQALSHSLQEKQGINNVPKLVAVLSRSTSEGVLKAAIQGLKLFFVESSQDLAPKRLQGASLTYSLLHAVHANAWAVNLGSVQTNPPSHVYLLFLEQEQQQQQPDAGTHEIYRQWLRRHYNAYISALITLITSKQHAAAVQTAATAAVMEAVRSEAGVGVFANDLYTRLLAAVATAEGVKPEVGGEGCIVQRMYCQELCSWTGIACTFVGCTKCLVGVLHHSARGP